MGVIMQSFYWDCPRLENKEYRWWSLVAGQIPALSGAGFTALWVPPASIAANLGGPSLPGWSFEPMNLAVNSGVTLPVASPTSTP